MRDMVQKYIFSQIKQETKINQLYDFLQQKCGGNAEKICIFGAGQKGKELFAELRKRLIDVYCFTDNNPDKYGYLLEGKYCIPLTCMEEEKTGILIIIAIENREWVDQIRKQLEMRGFLYMISLEEMNQVLSEIPCVRWMEQIYEAEEADFSTPLNREFVSRMNQLIFDICKYYEGCK